MGLRTPLYDAPRGSSAPASSISAAGTCRSTTARRSRSTTPCAATRACSTSRTCASSTCAGARRASVPAPPARERRRAAHDPGKALYSCMLREDGGVIDDLIVYLLDDLVSHGRQRRHARQGPRLDPRSTPAATASRSSRAHRSRDDRRAGPERREKAAQRSCREHRRARARARHVLRRATAATCSSRAPATPARTAARSCCRRHAPDFWRTRASAAGVAPCGLGARDTLRLEAGMNLYGNDMDETTRRSSPASAGRSRGSPQERDFIGRAALAEGEGAAARARKLVGLLLEDRGVLRSHQKVIVGAAGEGEVTSGTFSPTLERSIGLAPRARRDRRERCRSRSAASCCAARVVKPPFVRNGKTTDRTLSRSQHEQHSCRSALPEGPRVGAHAGRRHGRGRHHRSRAAGARRPRVRRGAGSGPSARRRATPARSSSR